MENYIGGLGIGLALAGALLTALPDPRIARWGFGAYLVADTPLCIYAALIGATPLAAMYAAFIVCALLGLYLRSPAGVCNWVRMLRSLERLRAGRGGPA